MISFPGVKLKALENSFGIKFSVTTHYIKSRFNFKMVNYQQRKLHYQRANCVSLCAYVFSKTFQRFFFV